MEERRVDVGELQLGMFVCRLDRPWEDTSFPLQGVELKSDEEIAQLRDLCEYVFIDAHRLVPDDRYTRTLRNGNSAETRFDRVVDYGAGVALEEEVGRAEEAFRNATSIVEDIVQDISAGRGLSVATVDRAVRPVVESVLRSADAFFWIESQRSRNVYLYKHSISCSALAAAFGRHMGFAEDTIISLAAGGLLLDVGKSRVNQDLLERPGPVTEDEMAELRRHVDFGVSLLEESDIGDRDVLDMVQSHHERYDGTGYPNGLLGNGIPLLARMAAIIDSYDAMISQVPYRKALSKAGALSRIYAGRDAAYQGELVEQFQACLGVYPTGSLVELSSGEVAVVMAQNQVRRLRPKVAVITNRDKQPIDDMWTMDLMQQVEDDEDAVSVVRSLKVGDHGLDPAEFFL
nr:HD-GYP domain-containing protein [Oleiagrimonas sp. C23AA]